MAPGMQAVVVCVEGWTSLPDIFAQAMIVCGIACCSPLRYRLHSPVDHYVQEENIYWWRTCCDGAGTKCGTVDKYTMLAKKDSLVTPIRKKISFYVFLVKFQDRWNLGIYAKRSYTHTTHTPASRRFHQTRCFSSRYRSAAPCILQLSLQNYLYQDNHLSYSIKQCMYGFLRTCSVNVAQQKYKICI